MRLAQYLALCGVGSRRHCQRLITAGRVSYQGSIASPTAKVAADALASVATILIDDLPIQAPEPKSYWLYHKPVGIDCRLLPEEPASLLHQLPSSPRLYPTGRLDKDSRGLILLTNDGELTQRLMHPDFGHSKRYSVELDRPFDNRFIANMAAGVSYGEISTLPCLCQPVSATRVEITLTQGLNRQIRRMAQALGYRVTDLKRTQMMSLTLLDEQGDELAEGKMRPLTESELTALFLAVGL